VSPAPIFVAADGSRWDTSNAKRGVEHFRVSERIVDSIGRDWTDVSAWFWSTALGYTNGPWWALTILEPAEPVVLKATL